MKKSDLKNGMIVEYCDGRKRLVTNNDLIGEDGYSTLSDYNDDLKNKAYNDLDITKVYSYVFTCSFSHLLDDDNLHLIWERKDIKLTKREVEILGALQVFDYEWLGRDLNGDLFAFEHKPEKLARIWLHSRGISMNIDKEVFAFIKWLDKEPTNIKELLK